MSDAAPFVYAHTLLHAGFTSWQPLQSAYFDEISARFNCLGPFRCFLALQNDARQLNKPVPMVDPNLLELWLFAARRSDRTAEEVRFAGLPPLHRIPISSPGPLCLLNAV